MTEAKELIVDGARYNIDEITVKNIRVLSAIVRGNRTVSELKRKFGVSRAAINHAIQKLEKAGLITVEYRMVGTTVFKYLTPKYSHIVIDLIGGVNEHKEDK